MEFIDVMLKNFSMDSPNELELRKRLDDTYRKLREAVPENVQPDLLLMIDQANAMRRAAKRYAFLSGYRFAEGLRKELENIPQFYSGKEPDECV